MNTKETLEQYRVRMKAELLRANNEDLLCEVKSVQKSRGWDFTRAWNYVLATQPAFQRNAPEKAESAGAADRSYAVIEAKAHSLIRESGGTLTMGQALSRARMERPVLATSKPVSTTVPGKTFLVRSIDSGRQLDFGAES
jgi:hypothetical protein